MNQADILNLLKNHGYDDGYVYKIVDGGELTGRFEDFITKLIELSMQLGAEQEREACSKLAQDLADMYAQRKYYRHTQLTTDAETGLRELEEAIRARNKS